MTAIPRRGGIQALFALLAGLLAWSAPAVAQVNPGAWADDFKPSWWLGADLGGAAVSSDAPAPSAGRNALAASLDFGYRFTPQLGVGFEFGAIAPLTGCTVWTCATSTADFAPNFTRLLAFGEYRVRHSGWRFRAGAGVSRFCYSRHWSKSAWGWGDTLDLFLSAALNDEFNETGERDGGYRCDGRLKAVGGTLSVGYDWPVVGAPMTMGLRLSAEAANFGATPSIGLPAFRHRALMLTLHLNIN